MDEETRAEGLRGVQEESQEQSLRNEEGALAETGQEQPPSGISPHC